MCVGRLGFELRTVVSETKRAVSLMVVCKKEGLRCAVRTPHPPIANRCVDVLPSGQAPPGLFKPPGPCPGADHKAYIMPKW